MKEFSRDFVCIFVIAINHSLLMIIALVLQPEFTFDDSNFEKQTNY